MHIDKRRLYHLDWYLILNGLILLAIGLMNLVSATRSIESGPYNLLLKQMVALCVGIAVLFLVLSYDYRLIASYARHFYWGHPFLHRLRPDHRHDSGRREEMAHYRRNCLPAFGADEARHGAHARKHALPEKERERAAEHERHSRAPALHLRPLHPYPEAARPRDGGGDSPLLLLLSSGSWASRGRRTFSSGLSGFPRSPCSGHF